MNKLKNICRLHLKKQQDCTISAQDKLSELVSAGNSDYAPHRAIPCIQSKYPGVNQTTDLYVVIGELDRDPVAPRLS